MRRRSAGAVPSTAPADLTEPEWQAWVAELARGKGADRAGDWCGWHVAHFRPCRTTHGWRTAGEYDAAGFPDLVLAHPRRELVLFRELKRNGGTLDPAQARWRDVLTDAGADFDVWRPADRDRVVHILTGGLGR